MNNQAVIEAAVGGMIAIAVMGAVFNAAGSQPGVKFIADGFRG